MHNLQIINSKKTWLAWEEKRMSLSHNFLCKICHKIRKEPVFLPCNCTSICRHHLDDILQSWPKTTTSTITCQDCHKVFEVAPEHVFKENKVMQQLIESNAHLNDQERDLKKRLDARCLIFILLLTRTLNCWEKTTVILLVDSFFTIVLVHITNERQLELQFRHDPFCTQISQ